MNKSLSQQLVEKGFVSRERAEILRQTPLKKVWQQDREEENTKKKTEKLRSYMSWKAVSVASQASVPESFFSSCALCGREIQGKAYRIPKALFTFLSKRFGQDTKRLRLCESCKKAREVK